MMIRVRVTHGFLSEAVVSSVVGLARDFTTLGTLHNSTTIPPTHKKGINVNQVCFSRLESSLQHSFLDVVV